MFILSLNKLDFWDQLPREKAETMKSFTQSAIANFVAKFLSDNGSEELVDAWNTQENIEAFNVVVTKGAKRSSDKIKDPNKPKRGKSAYIFFCAKKREEAKVNLGDGAKATEVTSELGRMWNALKASNKKADKTLLASLEAEAAEEKARYNEAMEDYVAPSDEELAAFVPAKKARKTSDKDPNAPKRGKSAYIFFCSATRPQVKEELGEEGKSSIMAELRRLRQIHLPTSKRRERDVCTARQESSSWTQHPSVMVLLSWEHRYCQNIPDYVFHKTKISCQVYSMYSRFSYCIIFTTL